MDASCLPHGTTPTLTAPHLLAPANENPELSEVLDLSVASWLVDRGSLLLGSWQPVLPSAALNLSLGSGVSAVPGAGVQGGVGSPANVKVEIAAVRRKLDSLPGDGRRKYDAKRHRAENSTTRVHSARLSRLHRLNPSRHHAPIAPAGRERRGAAISVCASCCIKGGMEALMGPDE